MALQRFHDNHSFPLPLGKRFTSSGKDVGAAKRSSADVVKEDKKSSVKVDSACPTKCGSQMGKRTTKKGSRAGQDFWGCFAFPKCRFTRSI